MADKNKQIKELQDAVKYEKLLEAEFAAIPRYQRPLNVVPQELQQDGTISQDALQVNLAKNNLKEIIQQQGLINVIIEYLRSIDSVIEFNKYFQTFKKSIANLRIASEKDFINYYDKFVQENLGRQLQPDVSMVRVPQLKEYSKQELDRMSDIELDNIFKEYIKRKENRIDPLGGTIHYIKNDNTLSKHKTTLTIRDGVLFITAGNSGNDKKKNRDAKIRYIRFYSPMADIPSVAQQPIISTSPSSSFNTVPEQLITPVTIASGLLKKKSLSARGTRFH